MKPLSLRKNFSWTLAGSLVASGCQWSMLIIMAKLLPIEQVGHYALALAITTPAIMFSMLQLRAVQVTDVQNQCQFGDYFGVRLITNLIASLVVIAILFLFIEKYDTEVYIIIIIVLFNKIIEATSDICYGLMQKHERLDKASQSMVYRNIGAMVLLSLVLYFTRSLAISLLTVGAWWLLVLFFFDRKNCKFFARFLPRFDIKTIFTIVWLGLPLGIARGLISLTGSTPRYFIETHLGFESLGVFAAMAYVVTGANRCVESLGYSAAAPLAKKFVNDRSSYIALMSKIVAIASSMALFAILFCIFFGKQFLAVVYKQDYAQYPDVFVWLMGIAGGNMICSMLQNGITAAKRFKSQVPLNIFTLLICFIGCYYFVPNYGMKGAAWAMLSAVTFKIICSCGIIILALKSPQINMQEVQ